LLAGLLLSGCEQKSAGPAPPAPPAPPPAPVLARSETCRDCHKEAFDKWTGSHHQLAHRDTGATPEDGPAFAGLEVADGPAKWRFDGGLGQPQLSWHDQDDPGAKAIAAAPIGRAIGYVPLVQYLVDFGGGRYQVPDLSWDPAKKEWFSIYEGQNRRPHEWGHWTQRGMNWNSQCAYCHHTGFHKNFDPAKDGYASSWIEQGIGCAQCHGPNLPKPADNGCLIDFKTKFDKQQWMHSCATCHARREELDEDFMIGDNFHDHYRLALPNQPGLYYADGQQLDEVYMWPSFLFSRMAHKGISCVDCHDPHTMKPKFEINFNSLCLQCHANGTEGATIIDLNNHMFHKPGTEGWRCVDCHMQKTPYMARDPRGDHMFPIPDPLMTKELGVPNACHKCHADKGLDWQLEWMGKWYGEKMNKYEPRRQRTRAIAAAHKGERGVLDKLLACHDVEEIAAWKATLLRLMEPWTGDSRVGERAAAAADHADPLVRGAAAMLLGQRGDRGDKFARLLDDPRKAVRFEAAWTALERLPRDHPGVEVVASVSRLQSDQPGGVMRLARLATWRGDRAAAEKYFRTATEWDRGSPAPRRDFAVFLAAGGRTREALGFLHEAAKLAPTDAEIPYLAALAHAELGETAEAENSLRSAIRIDPQFGRAQYNLGLLLNTGGRVEEAIACLKQAAAVERTNPDAPYAEATIHLRLGNLDAARAAAREALARNPDYQPAQQLLQQIGG
jgi:tetratricopeptide (TPR) repeat protein